MRSQQPCVTGLQLLPEHQAIVQHSGRKEPMSKPELKPGLCAERSIVVTHELTVQAAYPSLPAVYATPQMIYLMEMAAADAIAESLPAGWGSVGTRVDIEHLAATPVGMTVTAQAEVVTVDERIVRFKVSANDASGPIGRGYHERAMVELERFVRGVESKLQEQASS